MCSSILQSWMKTSRKLIFFAMVISLCTSSTDAGHTDLNVFPRLLQNQLPQLSCFKTYSQIAFPDPNPNSDLISSQCAICCAFGATWYFCKTEVIACLISYLLVAHTAATQAQASGSRLLGIKQLAIPAITTSSPLSEAPVMPKQYPMLFLSLDKKYVDPTSVQNPIFTSGIANTVLSVAMINGANPESPTPPPIAIPSQQEICKAFKLATLKSKTNSLLKKLRRDSTVACFSNKTFTSPPAQKAFPPAPCIHTTA